MMLLKEVNFYQTRKNARNVLKHYRRLERIAGRSAIDVRSPIITDMPKGDRYGNSAEEALLQKMDAEAERDAIVVGLMRLKLTSRQILYYSFCTTERFSNIGISSELGYSVRQIERMKSEALIEFAESYRNGKLISYR